MCRECSTAINVNWIEQISVWAMSTRCCLSLLCLHIHQDVTRSVTASCLGSFTIRGFELRPGANIHGQPQMHARTHKCDNPEPRMCQPDFSKSNNEKKMLYCLVLTIQGLDICRPLPLIFFTASSDPEWIGPLLIKYKQSRVFLPWRPLNLVRMSH